MANRGWNSRNHYPHNNAQIACRLCSQIFPNREALIAHIDSHLAHEEINLRNLHQTHPNTTPRETLRTTRLLASNSSRASLSMPEVNRNVFNTRSPAGEMNRNGFETRPMVPQVNRNSLDSRSLMRKVNRNDFDSRPLMQGANRNVLDAQTFWASPHPPAPPPPRRNPNLLTHVTTTPGSLQPALPLGSSATTNSTRSGATQRSQQRNVEEVATTTEQTTRPFIDMLERPIRKIDFIDLDIMDEDESGSQKVDLTLKL